MLPTHTHTLTIGKPVLSERGSDPATQPGNHVADNTVQLDNLATHSNNCRHAKINITWVEKVNLAGGDTFRPFQSTLCLGPMDYRNRLHVPSRLNTTSSRAMSVLSVTWKPQATNHSGMATGPRQQNAKKDKEETVVHLSPDSRVLPPVPSFTHTSKTRRAFKNKAFYNVRHSRGVWAGRIGLVSDDYTNEMWQLATAICTHTRLAQSFHTNPSSNYW